MAPGIARRERATLVVLRRRPDEALAARCGQRLDSAVEPFLRERLGLASPRPETGTPKQALGLIRAEIASIDG